MYALSVFYLKDIVAILLQQVNQTYSIKWANMKINEEKYIFELFYAILKPIDLIYFN